jgi:hypothetical protein
MTNYQVNQQVNVDGFLNASQNQIRVVASNATTNRIENPSFEMPTYNVDGTLRQFNWSYTSASGDAYPVTFHHAYAGSYAWKARMNSSGDVITYGLERSVQVTRTTTERDILSFYYYAVVDRRTAVYTVNDYSTIISEKTADFVVNIYGCNNSFGGNPGLVMSRQFTITSLPKNNPGNLDTGESGSMNPHFYPWNRFVLELPETIKEFPYFYFTITRTNATRASSFDFHFIIDAVQLEKQPYQTSATMYFDGSFEGFNSYSYPKDFQWVGAPHNSMSIRSHATRVNGELIGISDYCSFYVKNVSGLESPNEKTDVFTKTLRDGQLFADQVTNSRSVGISGRIITENESQFMESFARFQELIGKKPFSEPQPVRLYFELSFTNGLKFVPFFLDVVYASGLELDTANIFQSDIELTFQVVSNYIQYQNDSSSSMFNDNPLFDQFNTMNIDVLRNIGGLLYYNKFEEKWELPGNISFYKATDSQYTSTLPYGGTGPAQTYDAKTYYEVGDVHVIREDDDGIIWFGGRFDIVEIEGYWLKLASTDTTTTRFRIRASNIVGIRNRAMSGPSFIFEQGDVDTIENGPDLIEYEYHCDWQIIPLLDAPTRFSNSTELNPAFVGVPGAGTVRAIEFDIDGTMYIGGKFDFTMGGRRFINFASFKPLGSDVQNVNLYLPEHLYSFVSADFTQPQLRLNSRGRGYLRTDWVNSLIPYCKYGTFVEVGIIGPTTPDANSAVYDIKYDDFFGCLYIGGTFFVVSNTASPYVSFQAARIVKYDISGKRFINLDSTNTFGVNPATSAVSNNIIVRKILIQYLADGVNVFFVGKFTLLGTTVPVTAFGVGLFTLRDTSPNDAVVQLSGGGGFRISTPSESANFYDVVETSDGRIFVSGDFNRINKSILTPTEVTGIAEYRNGYFIDITRGLEANYANDFYNDIPTVLSMSVDSDDNIYFCGDFRNVKNKAAVDSVAKWDGLSFQGVGIYFMPAIQKFMQSILVDSADNIFLYTGPNTQETTILHSVYDNIQSYAPRAGVEVLWAKLSYPALSSIFNLDDVSIEFLVRNSTSSWSAGTVNCAVRMHSDVAATLPVYATYDTIFIGGRFDYIKIADTYFRVNNLVALRYDENMSPFPYRVLTFSSGRSPYYDYGVSGEDTPHFGVNCNDRNNVENGAVYSIDVKTAVFGAYTVPTNLYVGGRFDFTAVNTRFKNFIDIQLQRNGADTDIAWNIPENYEQNISVPYMNYALFRTPGLCGTNNRNDTVYSVRASHAGFATVTRTDPQIVYIGGDFTEVSNGNSTIDARRLAVYSTSDSVYPLVDTQYQYYKIDFNQTAGTPQGVAINTAFSVNTFVKDIAYVPWWGTDTGGTNRPTQMIPMGSWTISAGTPFQCGTSSITTGSPIARITISNTSGVSNFTTAYTGSNQYVMSGDVDYGQNLWVTGNFTTNTTQNNIVRHAVANVTSPVAVTNNVVASGNWGSIYQSALGLAHVPSQIYLNKKSPQNLYVTGANATPIKLFADASVVKFSGVTNLTALNYAYANVNLPQVANAITGLSIEGVDRKKMQAPTLSVGAPLAIQTNNDSYGVVSLPKHNYKNTLYDAATMQTFNCHNRGTISVYPTISLYCPFKGNVNTTGYIGSIINVTTGQEMYLNMWVQPGEIIRIRTEKERISVISNLRGDVTDSYFSSRNIRKIKIENAQIFRLVPGKNVIRYGPCLPLQRYFRSTSAVNQVVYNQNKNVVVPPIIVTLSWNIGFNSVHDALYTHVNPLLLR